jgi:hypothetical protein
MSRWLDAGSRRCGWSAPLLRQNEPRGRNTEDHQRSNDNVMGMWRGRRFQRYMQTTLGGAVMKIERQDRATCDRLVNVMEDIETGVLTEDSLSNKLPQGVADKIRKIHPRNKYDSDADWLDAVSELICGIFESLFMIREGMKTFAYELAIDVFADAEQSFEERNDAKIARAIKDLGQIKTMKAIGIGKPRAPATPEPLKQIESPTIQMVNASQSSKFYKTRKGTPSSPEPECSVTASWSPFSLIVRSA